MLTNLVGALTANVFLLIQVFTCVLRNSHPFENPYFCVVELVNVGDDEEMSVRERLSGITFSQFLLNTRRQQKRLLLKQTRWSFDTY
jgi:hypothetical protein